MKALSVGVVIPCYNGAAFLAEALESALNQTLAADTIIVVDDGSTDGSGDVARGFGVEVLRTQGNLGPSAARNLGIEHAHADAIAFLDADDAWLPHHIERVAGLLERFPEAAVASGAARFSGDREGVFTPLFPPGEPVDVADTALLYCPVPQMATIVRTEALERVGGYDERLRAAVDFDLWLRMSRHERFVCTHEVTASYRWHPGQISTRTLDQLRYAFYARGWLHERLVEEGRLREASRVAAHTRFYWLRERRDARAAGDEAWLGALDEVRERVPPASRLQVARAAWDRGRRALLRRRAVSAP